MTDAPQQPSLMRMSTPLIVSFWMRALFSLVDTAYAATIGDSAIAAIGLTVPLEFLMIALWVGLSTGLTSHLSRAMGARQACKVEQYVRTTWRLVGTAAPLFSLIGVGIWFYAPHMALEPEVARDFRIYGSVLVIGSGFTSFWSIVPDSIVKAHQDTRSTMWAGILSNVINVTLNTYFLFVLEWGIFGIAFSTVLGRIGGLAYALWRANQHESRRRAAWGDAGNDLDPSPYRSILALSFPSSLTFALMASEMGIVNFLLAKTPSPTESIAAFSIYHRVVLFASQPMIATAVAMLPFAGRLLGERDIEGIRKGLRQGSVAALLYCLVLGPLMIPLAPVIASWWAEAETTRVFAETALLFVPVAGIVAIPFFLGRPVFEAMGRGRPGLQMATLRYLVLSVPLAWGGMMLAPRLGYEPFFGVLVGMIVAAAIASLVIALWVGAALREKSRECPPIVAAD